MNPQYAIYSAARTDVSAFAASFREEAAETPTEELERRIKAYHADLGSWDRFALRFGFRQEPPQIWAYEVELRRRSKEEPAES